MRIALHELVIEEETGEAVHLCRHQRALKLHRARQIVHTLFVKYFTGIPRLLFTLSPIPGRRRVTLEVTSSNRTEQAFNKVLYVLMAVTVLSAVASGLALRSNRARQTCPQS